MICIVGVVTNGKVVLGQFPRTEGARKFFYLFKWWCVNWGKLG
jgi:hypothetical protein